MITNKLTESKIRKVSLASGQTELMLGDGGGLSLRITRSLNNLNKDNRYWIYRYTDQSTKKVRKLGLGSYPTINLTKARELAQNARVDPNAFRLNNQESVPTLQEAALAWFQEKQKSVTPDYAVDIWRSLELHVLPKLGDIPLSELAPRHVLDALSALQTKGNYETIRRVCKRLSEICDRYELLEVIPHNKLRMAHKLFTSPDTSRRQPAINVNEIPQLLLKLSEARCEFVTLAQAEFALHLALRPSECAQARWSEIDIANRCWTVPGQRMKRPGRALRGDPPDHRVPLSNQVIRLLQKMQPISSHREFVFPNRNNPSKHISSQSVNALLKRIGFKGELVAHGFRTLMSTCMNEQSHSPDAIEAALAHSQSDKTRAAYNRTDYYDARITLMQNWSEHLEQCAKQTNAKLLSFNT